MKLVNLKSVSGLLANYGSGSDSEEEIESSPAGKSRHDANTVKKRGQLRLGRFNFCSIKISPSIKFFFKCEINFTTGTIVYFFVFLNK